MLLRRHKKEVLTTIEDIPTDYTVLSYADLKSLAKDKGINSYKMSKEDLIEALNRVGE